MSSDYLWMSKKETVKFQVLMKLLSRKISVEEASLLLNVSQRTVYRWSKKVKEKGIVGLKHGNYGKKYRLKYSEEFKAQIIELVKKHYFDFNVQHIREVLKADHNIDLPKVTLWRWLRKERLVKQPRTRRRKKHQLRPRMPQEGLLLQLDGSHHRWNGKDKHCLISAIDDATSEIPFAKFFKGETTLGCMEVLREIIRLKGVPQAIYTDKAGWAGGNKREAFSQFARACEELGIQLLYANSPEAKGRIERSFRTFQDRLIPELRKQKLRSLDEMNNYLHTQFLPKYWNRNNTVAALEKTSGYSALPAHIELDEALCIREDRKITSDQTFSWLGQKWLVGFNNHNLSGYLATLKTTIDGHTRVYVMGKEVDLNQAPAPIRLHSPPPFKLTWDHYKMIYSTALKLKNHLVEHKVLGKPLKVA